MQVQWHKLLIADGWDAATERFWDEPACFYDLSTVKTVLLFLTGEDVEKQQRYFNTYYWKYGSHDLPDYLDATVVEIRRYKLHHSMNDLLWYDHGDRGIWPT